MTTDDTHSAMYDEAGQIVTTEGAADAVKWFAELWGSAEFDRGPQDYGDMVKRSIEALRANEGAASHGRDWPASR